MAVLMAATPELHLTTMRKIDQSHKTLVKHIQTYLQTPVRSASLRY